MAGYSSICAGFPRPIFLYGQNSWYVTNFSPQIGWLKAVSLFYAPGMFLVTERTETSAHAADELQAAFLPTEPPIHFLTPLQSGRIDKIQKSENEGNY